METESPRNLSRRVPVPPSKTLHPFSVLFLLHLTIVSAFGVALIINGFLKSPDHHHNFHPKKWFIPLLASILCSSISSLSWLLFIQFRPAAAMKSVFWLTPLFTLAAGVIVLTAGSPADLGVAVLAILSAVGLYMYGRSVVPELRHGIRMLKNCTGSNSGRSFFLTTMAVLISSSYSAFVIACIGGARSGSIPNFNPYHYKPISILLLMISMGWTMQVVKNTLRVAFSRVHHTKLLQGVDINVFSAFKSAIRGSFGTICAGSLLVPLTGFVRGSSRAMEYGSGGSGEMCCCFKECCSGIAKSLFLHGNRWGFVHVGAYGKKIGQASRDVWQLFHDSTMLDLIDADIGNSMFFLIGVAGGSLGGFVAGTWAHVVHPGYTTEVAVYAFFLGYFITRIGLAWPQAVQMAYYVAYAETQDALDFEGTMEVRMYELEIRDQKKPE